MSCTAIANPSRGVARLRRRIDELAAELAARTAERDEALAQQSATAEILQVINSCQGDPAPVFEAMLDKALQLCGAAFGILWTYDGERMHAAAHRGLSQAFAELLTRTPHPIGPDNTHGRLLRGESVVHISDAAEDKAFRSGDTLRRALVDEGGRTLLAVPLRKDDAFLGNFIIYRQEVRPFTDQQIALLQSFAAQAVIAIENTRLLTELRESLEQQQAIAEVLQVINRSPGDLAPVFDVVLEKALRLCGASFGVLSLYKGDDMHQTVAMRDVPPQLADLLKGPVYLGPETGMGRLVRGERIVHIADAADDEGYRGGNPVRRMLVDVAGTRTYLAVPLRKEETLVGAFTIYRTEVSLFTDKQIALLESFAAQAIIAMDNARLLNEIRQRQAELRVTFDNMGDGVAMFDADLRLAAWNRNFQQILDLPEELLAGRPRLADYVRYLATHGEYGAVDVKAEVRRLVGAMDHQWSTERTRPDGRVIEVRVNPVPGGGIVLIYGDVTERKRAEAEIRAARDAAEKALAELRATQQQLVVQQKMAALGQLTAGIAHEIKNPLNFVNNFAGLSVELLDELKEAAAPAFETLDDGARAEIDETIAMLTGNLDKIAEHGRRADGIVKSMLAHSRGSSGERQSVDLNALIDEALNLAYHGARAQDQSFNITMERDFAAGLAPIELVPQDVTRVFLNLIGNGFYAAHKRARGAGDGFRPVLKVTTRDLGKAIEIKVRDNGTGIAPEHREKLFQPFFTTKPTGEGTGLGLSISYDIVTQQHGGTITVASEVGSFTEFTVHLPRPRQRTTTGRAA